MIEMLPELCCFIKGTAMDTMCIVERTLTFIISSYSGIVALVGPTIPFSAMVPWQMNRASILPPKCYFMQLVNFCSMRSGSLRSTTSIKKLLIPA